MVKRAHGCWLCLTLLLWARPALGFLGVSGSIDPPISTVVPNQVFDVVVRVDSIGTPCSGFENTLAWDGQLLEFVSFQPETRLEELSWSEWRAPEVYPDSTHIYIMIYWFQGFLDEPGPLYSFTFRALQYGETPVRLALARFGAASGGGIQPVLTHDGVVVIADPSSGVRGTSAPVEPRLRVVPNPLTPTSRIEARLPSGGPAVIQVFDAAGRLQGRREIFVPSAGTDQTGSCSIGWSDFLLGPGAEWGVHWIRLSTRDGSFSTTAVGR